MSARWTVRLAAFLAAFLLLADTVPAQAADGFQASQRKDFTNGSYWCVEGPGGLSFACFEDRGDWLQVGDMKEDGRRAGVRWTTSDGRSGVCVHTSGHWAEKIGVSLYVGYRACNKAFDRGVTVTIRAGTCDGSRVNCSVLRNWRFGAPNDYRNS